MFLCDAVNTSFNAFMNMFVYYFKRAFPLKIIYVKDQNENKWNAIFKQFKENHKSFKRITGLY